VAQEEGTLAVVARGSRRPLVVARNLRTPLGLAWQGQLLFVSQQGRLERFVLRGGKLGSRRTLVRGLPFGGHQQDNVVVGGDGRLYLGSGSTCDACRERDRRSATILSLRPDGSDLRILARGLRNPFGLAIQPGTKPALRLGQRAGRAGDRCQRRPSSSCGPAPSTDGHAAGRASPANGCSAGAVA